LLKEDLTAGSVPRHLVRLAIPMFFGISSMMVASMIDTIYIGWIGTVELAAVSFSFPVVMALSSVSMGLGVGATSIISRTLGGGDRQRALVLGSHTLLLVALFVATLAVLGFVFVEPIFRALGADEVTLSLLAPYMKIWFFGLPLFAVPMVSMSMLRAFGNARTPGVLMTGGALLQVLIAPGLIFGLPGPGDGIGYLGSAWAFVASRVLVFAATMVVLSRRGLFQPVGAWSGVLASWREVLRIGVPSILTNLIGPASMAVVFGLLARHGHEVVAGFGIAVRIESLALMILMAFSSSLGPLIGQNLGAHRHDRIHEALRFGYRFAFGWGLFAFVVLAALGRPIVALINDHPGVIEATYAYLVPVSLSYGFLGVSMVVGSTFLASGRAAPSLVLALMRMLVLYLPLAWLGNALWGYHGIFYATAVCNVIVAVAGYMWLRGALPDAAGDGGTHRAR
jgi:putative MATE family efflux protein